MEPAQSRIVTVTVGEYSIVYSRALQLHWSSFSFLPVHPHSCISLLPLLPPCPPFPPLQAYVVPPAEIAFLPTKVEAVVGTALVLPLHVKGYTDEGDRTLLPFADCRKLPLEVTSLDTSVFNLSINSAAGVVISGTYTTPHVQCCPSIHNCICTQLHMCTHHCICPHAHHCTCTHAHMYTCSHVHMLTTAHVHMFTTAHVHMFNTARVHMFTTAHVHMFTTALVHIFTTALAHVHMFTTAHAHHCTCAPLHMSTCSPLHMFTTAPSLHIRADLSSLPSGACVSLQAVATKAGNSKVTVTYKYKDITLSASVTIAAYNPLVSVDPESIAVLTLGSSKNFIFEGGPAPWVLDRSRYYEECK